MDVRHHSVHARSPMVLVQSLGGADRVEFLYGKFGGVDQHECVRLCRESEEVVDDLDGGEGYGVGVSGRAPGGRRLYIVNCLEESMCRRGEVGRHCIRVMGLSVFVCSEEFVQRVKRCRS